MLSLLADHGFCFLAEQLFLEQLPEDIRLQLSNDDFTHPRVLATKADVLWIAKQQAATTRSADLLGRGRSLLSYCPL